MKFETVYILGKLPEGRTVRPRMWCSVPRRTLCRLNMALQLFRKAADVACQPAGRMRNARPPVEDREWLATGTDLLFC
jgi:hypothetical protein